MNKLHIAILYFALTSLMSCSDNLFGSSSSGDCGKDIKCLRMEAENAFRSSKCEDAYKTYSKITGIDSTASVGYFGMAQAGLCMKGINPFDIFRFADLNKLDDGKIPFRDDSIKVQNRYYQGMKLAYNALIELNRRDSLTTLYELHKKDSSGQAGYISDSSKKLDGFRNEFGPLYKGFPLSDREYKPNAYYGGLSVSIMAKTMLEFFDINSDNCITKGPISGGRPGIDYPASDAEWEKWDCIKIRGKYDYDTPVILNSDGTIDYEQMLDYLENKLEDFYGEQEEYLKRLEQGESPEPPELPSEIEDINKKIGDFTGNLDEVISVLGGVGTEEGDQNDWQAEMNKYKDYASFFKMGTRIDEDGDGCVDEELLNQQDNDLDGINGENARVASLEPSSPLFGKTGINHSMIGENPEAWENINNPINLPVILGYDNDGVAKTAIGFTQEPGYWSSNDLDLKLKVAKDTICPPKYDLKFRQDSIGGCWKYYDDKKFAEYWLKRKLALDPTRIHPTCKACRTTNECLGK